MYPSAVHVADALLGQHERELEVLRETQANKVKGQIDIKYTSIRLLCVIGREKYFQVLCL